MRRAIHTTLKQGLATLIIACMLPAARADDAASPQNWLPVKDGSLVIGDGSILDFSSLAPPPKQITARLIVNPKGYFATEDKPQKEQRFLMASLGFGAATGSFPDHATADLYARQLRVHGYNMARVDFVEDTLMTGRHADFDFDPEQFDRFHYLLSALKNQGIYYMLNGLSSGNGAYGDVAERWVDKHHLKLGVFYDADAQAHWKTLMQKMLGTKNPYGDIAPLDDPAMAGLIMVNEGGLAFLTHSAIPDVLRPAFNAWLARKYGNTAAMAKVWGGEIGNGEALESKNVAFPKADAWTSHRMSDTQQFFTDLEKSTADWMSAYMHQLGYRGLLTAYDNWLSPSANYSRGQFDWIDLHNYYAEPSNFIAPGSVMRQDSMFGGGAKYIAELAANRHIGKAFTVSEYGQVFWNKYRRESALAIPAYAAFQQWSMICQHAGAIMLSYGATGGRKDAIYPFMIGLDPIARADETLAALLFLRGDVAPARHMLGVKLDPHFAYDDNPLLGSIPFDIARAGLVSGIGIDEQGRLEGSGKYEAQIQPGSVDLKVAGKGLVAGDQGMLGKLDSVAQQFAGRLGAKAAKNEALSATRFDGRAGAMRSAGLLPANNATSASDGIYQTDTGEVILDSQHKRMTVVTPRTEAVVFDDPQAIALDRLIVEQSDGPALVSISAMDGAPLQSSGRMLLIVATDARNSGMQFADAAETTLQKLGKLPVQMRTIVVKLKLRNTNAAHLKVFSDTLRGARGDAIAVTHDADSISFVLDTSKLSHGPTTYFEVVAQ
ncbi:MAG TPA: hypothetical protein VIF60_07575 [Burkholderiaceae bacterium]